MMLAPTWDQTWEPWKKTFCRIIFPLGRWDEAETFWIRRFSTLLLFCAWLLPSTNPAMIRGCVSSLFLPATPEMLAWTLTNTPTPSLGKRRQVASWAVTLEKKIRQDVSGVWDPARSFPVLSLSSTWKNSPDPFPGLIPHLQNGNPLPSRTADDHCELRLWMMLRTLGTYKYFLRRAGISLLAIRLEEVCSISSVHL